MKKFLSALLLVFVSMSLSAQSFSINIIGDVPESAANLMQQRFTQMLSVGGLKVQEGATPLQVSPIVVEQMATPGAMSQSVVVLAINAKAGDVEETFTVKGVGKNDDDAWLRAVKQLIPTSRTAREFVKKLK